MSARRAVTRAALVTGAAALIALGVMAARVWPGGSGAGDGGPIRIASADLDRGARLYDAHCAACHGAGLEGEADWRTPRADGTMPAPPHDGTGQTWHHGDRLLFRYTKLGGRALLAERGLEDVPSAMPGFADRLSDAEIRDVIAFIKSRWPAEKRAHQRRLTEAETPR